VQLDRVRGDPGLAVVVVEGSDADHVGAGAGTPNGLARPPHLESPVRGRVGRAGGRIRRFRDHLARAGAQDDVVVLVGLLALEARRGDHAEDVALEREPPGRDEGRPGNAGEMRERRRLHRQEARPVLERLDRPALEAARANRARDVSRGWGGHARHDRDDHGDEHEQKHPTARPRSHRDEARRVIGGPGLRSRCDPGNGPGLSSAPG